VTVADGALIGREAERARLAEAVASASAGAGSLVLVAGEAGVGKTRLAEEALREADAVALRGGAAPGITVPYGSIAAALRSRLRTDPDAFAGVGPLLPHLALILPELGRAAPETDRPTLFEAVRSTLAQVAGKRPAVVLLDDLHWSDGATLELLGALAQPLVELPVLVIGTYRSDGLPRDHPLRALRNDLRRGRLLNELSLEPLDLDATAALLGELLDDAPSPALARTVHERTQGVPFFVEELARALSASGSLGAGRRGLELRARDDVPVPDTVRDAVRLATADLSDDARAAAESAAVAGEAFELELIAGVASADGIAELVEHGVLREGGDGMAAFRHALAREAIYADVPWLRRRELHRRLGNALASAGASSFELATHWLGARDSERAREALLAAVEDFAAVHAYRDAAAAAHQAIELWPEAGEDGGERRLRAVVRYAECAELGGNPAEAARAWREVSTVRERAGEDGPLAEACRRLAGAYELTGDRERAFGARERAAEAFSAAGRTADASLERLAMANHHRLGARHRAAVELARAAAADADAAGRPDLRARALGLEGMSRAKGGEYDQGLETARAGLALALELDQPALAAELYQRLSVVLYDAADYGTAMDALDTALELCRIDGGAAVEGACVSCMAYVLRERGDWQRAIEVSNELIAAGEAVFVAEAMLGMINGFRGKWPAARRGLSASHATAARLGHYSMVVDTTAGLAVVAAGEGAADEAADHCRALVAAWERSDDHHYAVWGLRWAASYLIRNGDAEGARACTDALTRIAAEAAYPDALAAVAQALGEAALRDGEVDVAAEQMARALELHRGLEIPYERAQVQVRAGVALAAAGDRDAALVELSDAYRTARKLGAAPLAAEAAAEVKALGESVERRLGRRAESDVEHAGLSRRELQVVRLVAVGRTNKEIASELFLSPRTVDMHVRNILRKLDSRSRVEAARRAEELGVLD
jgi:DNA-binding CsgD family transcriptional regulator